MRFHRLQNVQLALDFLKYKQVGKQKTYILSPFFSPPSPVFPLIAPPLFLSRVHEQDKISVRKHLGS